MKKCNMESDIHVGDVLLEMCPNYVKVIYQGTVIYDDTDTNPAMENAKEGELCFIEPLDITQKYFGKVVERFTVEVVQFHHFIIDME